MRAFSESERRSGERERCALPEVSSSPHVFFVQLQHDRLQQAIGRLCLWHLQNNLQAIQRRSLVYLTNSSRRLSFGSTIFSEGSCRSGVGEGGTVGVVSVVLGGPLLLSYESGRRF